MLTAEREPTENRTRLVQRPCEARFLGLEIGASQRTLPVGAERFRRTPHIALSGAFLAQHASVCNRWPRRWVSGRRREWRPGRTCRIDRKSTRLNSSHLGISYAVFCLKKNKKQRLQPLLLAFTQASAAPAAETQVT